MLRALLRLWKGPDILSCNLTIRRARSATLLSRGTRVSSRSRSTWSASSVRRVARFQALRSAVAPAARVALAGRAPGWQQVEHVVDDLAVAAADLLGPGWLHGRQAGGGRCLRSRLGLHENACHLGGPGGEKFCLAYVFQMPEQMSPALSVQARAEVIVRGVAVVHERAGIIGQDADVGEGFDVHVWGARR